MRVNSQALIRGMFKEAEKAVTYIGLYVCSEIFLHCDATARALQQENITAYESMSAADLAAASTKYLRNGCCCISDSKTLELKAPSEKRRTKTPARLRHDGESEAREDENIPFETELRASFHRGLDLMLNEIDERFTNEGVSMAIQREQLIMKSATDSTYVDSVVFDSLSLPSDRQKLALQAKQLKDFLDASSEKFQRDNVSVTVSEVAQLLGSQNRITQILFSELIRLAALCLSQPCSNASSERAFSVLRRLKTWLRNTIFQKRLTHLGLMTTSRDIVQNLDRKKAH